MADSAVAARERRLYVIFLTDRRRLGGDIRLVPAPRFKGRSTAMIHRSARFGTAQDANKYLRELERIGRYCYTVGEL